MTQAPRPGEDVQATSSRAVGVSGAAATAPDLPGRTLGHRGYRRGGLAPVLNDSERTQAETHRDGSP